MLGAFLAVATIFGGHAWLNSEAALQQLHGKVERSLRDRIGMVRLEDRVRVDWLGRVILGPVSIPAENTHRPPVVHIETVLARPNWPALLRGRIALASLELHQVRVETGPDGEELIRLIQRLGTTNTSATPNAPRTDGPGTSLPAIELRGLVLVLRQIGIPAEATELGPFAGRISTYRVADGSRLDARLTLVGGGSGRLSLVRDRGITSLRATLERVWLSNLPHRLTERLPFVISGGQATVRVEVRGLTSPAAGEARLEIDLDHLTLDGKRLASEPVGPMHLALRGQVQWDWYARRLSLKDAELAIGNGGRARAEVEAELTRRSDVRFSASARVDGLGYASALAALPTALLPPADAPQLDGPVSGRLSVSGAMNHPEDWRLDASLDLSGLKRMARAADPPILAGTFSFRPMDSNRQIRIGPGNPDFVRLADLPSYVVRAVTTSEDAGFFGHQGFDFAELRNVFVESAEAGRLVRGGSTISQQLAKNLFLSSERTLARKVREALLTVALEASLGKSRLLEIYLNIVEWGPGIYGLGEAARHYFGKEPNALTPREAAFLATIIPNPVRYHHYYERGSLTDAWNARVDDLLLKMRDAGQLADEQLAQALAEPLVFDRG